MIAEDIVLDALRQVIDPDIGVNIVDLGLIEHWAVTESSIRVAMIMTTPACPQSSYIRDQAERLIRAAVPHADIVVEVLPAPFWEASRMSPAAKRTLGW